MSKFALPGSSSAPSPRKRPGVHGHRLPRLRDRSRHCPRDPGRAFAVAGRCRRTLKPWFPASVRFRHCPRDPGPVSAVCSVRKANSPAFARGWPRTRRAPDSRSGRFSLPRAHPLRAGNEQSFPVPLACSPRLPLPPQTHPSRSKSAPPSSSDEH